MTHFSFFIINTKINNENSHSKKSNMKKNHATTAPYSNNKWPKDENFIYKP